VSAARTVVTVRLKPDTVRSRLKRAADAHVNRDLIGDHTAAVASPRGARADREAREMPATMSVEISAQADVLIASARMCASSATDIGKAAA
jgi:hypothetical protein